MIKGDSDEWGTRNYNNDRECFNYKCRYGCCGIFGFVTPFHWCEDWSKANEEDIEENKDKIDECCKENRIKRIEDNKGLIEVYKKDLDKSINKILELMSME